MAEMILQRKYGQIIQFFQIRQFRHPTDLTKTTKKFEFIFDKKHDKDTTEHHEQ